MKIRNVVLAVLMIALALFIMLPNLSWAAEDGAAIYKAKCASCHGADGAGKPTAKIPALKGTSATDAQIVDIVVKGDAAKKAPHSKAINGVPDEQAKAVATFVKGLK